MYNYILAFLLTFKRVTYVHVYAYIGARVRGRATRHFEVDE